MSGGEELLQINSIYDDMSLFPHIKRLYDVWYNKSISDPKLKTILQRYIREDLKNTLPKTLLLQKIFEINNRVSIDKAETLSEIIDRLKKDGFDTTYPADKWHSEFDVDQTEILIDILYEGKAKMEKEFQEVEETHLDDIKNLILLEASRLYHAYNTVLNMNTPSAEFTSEERQGVMMYAQLYKLKGKGNEHQPRGLEEIFKDLSLVLKYIKLDKDREDVYQKIGSIEYLNTALHNVFNKRNYSKIIPIYNEVLGILDGNIKVSVVELNINVKMFLKFKNIFLGMILRFQYLIDQGGGKTNGYIDGIRGYIQKTIDGNLSTWTGDQNLLKLWEQEAVKNNTGQNIQNIQGGGKFIDNCVGDDILKELVDKHKFVKLCSYSSIVDPGDQCTLYNHVMESIPFITNIELKNEYFSYNISAENNNNPGTGLPFEKKKRGYPKVKLTSKLSLSLNLGTPLPQNGSPFKQFTLNDDNRINVISEIVWDGKKQHNHAGPLSASTICLEAVERFVALLSRSRIVNENINDELLSIFFKKTLGDLGQELEALEKGYGFVSNDRPSFVRYAYLKKIQHDNGGGVAVDVGWGGYTPKTKKNSVFIDSNGNYIKSDGIHYITQGVFKSSKDNKGSYGIKLNDEQYKTLLYLLLHDLMHDYYGFGEADSYTKTGRWTVNGALFPIFSDKKMQEVSSKMNIEITSKNIHQIQTDTDDTHTKATIHRLNKTVIATGINDQISSLPLDEDEDEDEDEDDKIFYIGNRAKRQKIGGYKQIGGALDTNVMVDIARIFYNIFTEKLREESMEGMNDHIKIIYIIISSFQTWINIVEVKQVLYYDIEEIISVLNILIEDPLKSFNTPSYMNTYIYTLMIYICTTYKIDLLKELVKYQLQIHTNPGMNLKSSGLKSIDELTNIKYKILNINLSSVIYNSNIVFIPLDYTPGENLTDNYGLYSLIEYIKVINDNFWEKNGDNNTYRIIKSRLYFYILEQIEYERRNMVIKSAKLNKRKTYAIESAEKYNLEIIKQFDIDSPETDIAVQFYESETNKLKNIIPEIPVNINTGKKIFTDLNNNIKFLTEKSNEIRNKIYPNVGGTNIKGKKIKKKTLKLKKKKNTKKKKLKKKKK